LAIAAIAGVTGAASTPPSADRLWADASLPAGAKASDLEMRPCVYHSQPDDRDFSADCGAIVVPEQRRRPGGRLIVLPIIRVRATGAAPGLPIFTFQGGPGAPNRIDFPIAALAARHDLVMVGYRGVDGSRTLDCPEVSSAFAADHGAILGPAALTAYAAGARACADRLESAGVDLDGYSMAATVDDQEDARRALHYGQVDLLGGSYGTRLEQIYVWRYPESLGRVVMIGVNPPGGFAWTSTDGVIAQYARLCAADAGCWARTPDLMQAMRRVSAHMPASWLGVPIEPDRVRLMSFLGLHETVAPKGGPPVTGPAVIDAWQSAAAGDPSGLAFLSALSHLLLPHLIHNWGHFLAMGSSANDYARLTDRDIAALAPHDAIIGAPGTRLFSGLVRGWPWNSARADYAAPPPSDTEALLIEGTLDATTPLAPARDQLLPKLRRGHLVALAELGHTVSFWNSQPKARDRLLSAFLDEGRVDTSLYAYQAPVFAVQNGFGSLAREALAAAAIGVIAVIGVAWLGWRGLQRRHRRKRVATPPPPPRVRPRHRA
jgi:pimeloyl-ACP methyl ester carboxylesterase